MGRPYSRPTPKESMDTKVLSDQIEVVIFDCDGVMFDSRKANIAFYNNAFGFPSTYLHISHINMAIKISDSMTSKIDSFKT